jgi:hypothetical protein
MTHIDLIKIQWSPRQCITWSVPAGNGELITAFRWELAYALRALANRLERGEYPFANLLNEAQSEPAPPQAEEG